MLGNKLLALGAGVLATAIYTGAATGAHDDDCYQGRGDISGERLV